MVQNVQAERDIITNISTNIYKAEPVRSPLGIAPPLPSLVVGREDDLYNLKIRLRETKKNTKHMRLQVLTAIRGWPGVGKTTIAATLAHDQDIVATFSDGVLWVSLGQSPNLFLRLAEWGRVLGIDDLLQEKSLDEASKRLVVLLRDRRMLLIVDDVWDSKDVIPFMIGGSKCAMLITTRITSIAHTLVPTPQDIYKLNILSDEKSFELLQLLAPTVVTQHPQATLELIHELEGLPLALQVAGRLLFAETSYGFNVEQLLAELREGVLLLNAQTPIDRSDLVNETSPSVATLLKRSTDHLDPLSRECFGYLGAFAPKPATFDLLALQAIWQMDDPKRVVRELVDRGLLEAIEGRFQLHALLVMHAKTLLVQ